jgi:hypothetical protein
MRIACLSGDALQVGELQRMNPRRVQRGFAGSSRHGTRVPETSGPDAVLVNQLLQPGSSNDLRTASPWNFNDKGGPGFATHAMESHNGGDIQVCGIPLSAMQ